MLVVNGHPRSDIEGLKDHQRNLLIIIKDYPGGRMLAGDVEGARTRIRTREQGIGRAEEPSAFEARRLSPSRTGRSEHGDGVWTSRDQ